jgi:hypothetical protein
MFARLALRLVIAWVATLGAWVLAGPVHVELGLVACAAGFGLVVTARNNKSAAIFAGALLVVLAIVRGVAMFVAR